MQGQKAEKRLHGTEDTVHEGGVTIGNKETFRLVDMSILSILLLALEEVSCHTVRGPHAWHLRATSRSSCDLQPKENRDSTLKLQRTKFFKQ